MRRICAWCGTEVDPVSAEALRAHAVTHAICEPCREKLLGSLGTPLHRLLDSLGVPVLLVSGRVESERLNEPAVAMVGRTSESVRGQLLGNVFECVNARLPEGCGRTRYGSGCAIRGVGHPHAGHRGTHPSAPGDAEAGLLQRTARGRDLHLHGKGGRPCSADDRGGIGRPDEPRGRQALSNR